MKARAFAWLAACMVATSAVAQERVLDDFEAPLQWKAVLSDGVSGALAQAPGHDGHGLRLDFDFGTSAGYAAARRKLPLDFDGDVEISFWMRADAPVNNLEFKLVDASGENVWWVRRPDFAISKEWRKYTFKKRHITFAWGPAKDHTLRHTENIEFVVSTGRDGGHGSVYIDDLTIRRLAPDGPEPEPRFVDAPQSAAGLLAGTEAWTAASPEAHMTIDFGRPREFGGVKVHWGAVRHARRYDIELSDDAVTWRTVRRVLDGDGGVDPILLGETESRFLRLALHEGPGDNYRIERLELEGLDQATPNAFFQALARQAPPGTYPRGMSGQQNYWTVLGVDGGTDTGLLSEDGALEVARGGFTVEPFVVDGGRVISWADVKAEQSLAGGYLPIPSVTWDGPGWRLRTTAFAHGTADRSQLVARYELDNDDAKPRHLRLVLAVRPFQVNPPMQFLNTAPGVSRIDTIAWNGQALEVNGRPRVFALNKPDAAGTSTFDADAIPNRLAGEGWSAVRRVKDESGFASGALAYDFTLQPGASANVALAIPLGDSAPAAMSAQAMQDETEAAWRARLNRGELKLPPQAQWLADTVRSSLAHILMTRSGPALMPGTRSYARSWIRDGAMMSEALLRLGNEDVARDYARWFAQYQFASGKIPCCVDHRGSDPVPENDSQGEFIFLAGSLWRYTHDRALLEDLWPHVLGAAAYMEQQRQSERIPANLAPGRRALYGLLPASISHEGYSAKPMHSYWDDFWGLRGYRDAALLAGALEKKGEAAALAGQGDEFERDIVASLGLAARQHGIGYLAGAAELGDFDATSTTIALSPGGLQYKLPQGLLNGTFERYWSEFVARRDGVRQWADYTPYELRNVAAFVRLGWRARAHELLAFFAHDRRPQGWNQWAEVVGRDMREPRFVGDMPHGWVASDFIRSALDLFAWEREDDHALVVADGIPDAWLAGEGIAVRDLRTPYGPLSYDMRRRGTAIELDVHGLAAPPGGIVLRAPETGWLPGRVTVNGKPARLQSGELRVRTLPASITIEPGPAAPVSPPRTTIKVSR